MGGVIPTDTILVLIIATVVIGVLLMEAYYYHQLKQEVEELWHICREYADIVRCYDEELKSLAARMKILEDGQKR